jgi:hypothetical protein
MVQQTYRPKFLNYLSIRHIRNQGRNFMIIYILIMESIEGFLQIMLYIFPKSLVEFNWLPIRNVNFIITPFDPKYRVYSFWHKNWRTYIGDKLYHVHNGLHMANCMKKVVEFKWDKKTQLNLLINGPHEWCNTIYLTFSFF